MARKRTKEAGHRRAFPHNGYMMTLFAGALMLFSTLLSATGGAAVTGFAIADNAGSLDAGSAVGMGFLIGLVVLGSAILMRDPGRQKIGGGIAAVCSVVALLTGVGFIVGGLVGLVGAIFALGNV